MRNSCRQAVLGDLVTDCAPGAPGAPGAHVVLMGGAW